jgi:hypothetical protein
MTKRQLNLAGWLSIANAVLLSVSFTMTVLVTLLAQFARTITGWLLASLFLAPLGFLFAVQADVFLGSIFFNIARES